MRRKKTEGADDAALTQEPMTRQRLTPADIQQAEFRLSMRGYNEREVDELLDRLTEDWGAVLEENKRLREQGGSSVAVSDSSVADARREAEEIIARARAEAAAIVRDAGANAPSAPPIAAAEVGAVSSFLTRERDFLQSLGRLVQGHAESVKSMAQNAKASEAKPAATPSPQPATPAPSRGPTSQATPAPAPQQPATQGTPATTAPSPQPAATSGPPTQPVVRIDADDDRPVPERASVPTKAPQAQAAPARQAQPARQPAPQPPQPATVRVPDGGGEGAQGAPPSERPAEARKGREEELSLRELFWGDE